LAAEPESVQIRNKAVQKKVRNRARPKARNSPRDEGMMAVCLIVLRFLHSPAIPLVTGRENRRRSCQNRKSSRYARGPIIFRFLVRWGLTASEPATPYEHAAKSEKISSLPCRRSRSNRWRSQLVGIRVQQSSRALGPAVD
jgi:hypothetical protein